MHEMSPVHNQRSKPVTLNKKKLCIFPNSEFLDRCTLSVYACVRARFSVTADGSDYLLLTKKIKDKALP